MPDWTQIEQYPESTIFCRCGHIYRSHAMFDKESGRMAVRKACPKCSKSGDAWKISSDPESMTITEGGR